MSELPPLDQLSPEEKDVLIGKLWQELKTLRDQVEKLNRKRVKKTSKNSSLPLAKGFKPNQVSSESVPQVRQASLGRTGGGRELSQHADQVVVAQARTCPHCEAHLSPSQQQLRTLYECIECR
ncbi:MAG: hypothetical protein AAGE59_16455 [Cyanobacteria bacterium P01_F01_bin.86]